MIRHQRSHVTGDNFIAHDSSVEDADLRSPPASTIIMKTAAAAIPVARWNGERKADLEAKRESPALGALRHGAHR